MSKKQIRKKFREETYKRDKNTCRGPGCVRKWQVIDAHHITDRKEMPHGGYVVENGITLCEECHFRAEVFHSTGVALEGWSPDDLYKIIGSSKEKALEACKRLASK